MRAEKEPLLASELWDEKRKNLLKYLQDNDDWSGFKKWPPVQSTMYSNNRDLITRMIEYMGDSRWAKLVDGFPNEECTVVRHAYFLTLYERVMERELCADDTFIEFGGGYGEMPRLISMIFIPKQYIVYDFPEVGLLQKWYWDKNIKMGRDRVSTTYNMQDIRGMKPTVFFSFTGISEAPAYTQRYFLDSVSPESMLIQYQPKWGGNDNDKFFTEFAEQEFSEMVKVATPNYASHQNLIAWSRR